MEPEDLSELEDFSELDLSDPVEESDLAPDELLVDSRLSVR